MHSYFTNMADSYAQTLYEDMVKYAHHRLQGATNDLSLNEEHGEVDSIEHKLCILRIKKRILEAEQHIYIAERNIIRQVIEYNIDDGEFTMGDIPLIPHLAAWVGVSKCILKVGEKEFLLDHIAWYDEAHTMLFVEYFNLANLGKPGEIGKMLASEVVSGLAWPTDLK